MQRRTVDNDHGRYVYLYEFPADGARSGTGDDPDDGDSSGNTDGDRVEEDDRSEGAVGGD